MNIKDISNLLEEFREIDVTKDVPYSILNTLYTEVPQKELAHSNILASFLNPAENHGHESLFLKQFLIDIGLDDVCKFEEFKNINVYTERRIKVSDEANSRPIDILITWDCEFEEKSSAIIIENKLNYAPDQPGQLIDYYKGIKREGYNVKKVVYIHIDKNIKKTLNVIDVVNYNVQNLIKSLEKCNTNTSHSHITEYINLLKNNIHNYKYMETALKIQSSLINKPEDFKKLVELSKIVNSKEWHEAKFEIFLDDFHNYFADSLKQDKLKLSEVKRATQFNAYYRDIEFENEKYWINLWSNDESVKLYICCFEENKKDFEKIHSNFEDLKIEYESNWGSWRYYLIEDGSSDLDVLKKIIEKILPA
ncbi:hypothetical protein EC396_04225 [Lutibacter sp. HS1-25]|uniref:PD-(D/E)XK nuclease family protein n=1 Tax=Lutibacter sp. HS1-25 TaxID=2485000 RepID=UPI0010126D8B|nr:PD-(D/E)XK nuclease family protein [Lutibacter sp. HS1-25]RXP60868.1 hypothetical protein EC396_04225 [Lutibacter sp. HS1-25]